MNTATKKLKGKRLENLVRDRLIEAFNLDPEDIRIPISSENGTDIKLNKKAKLKFPFQVECKNQEIFTTIYKYYLQAYSHKDGLVPLLVIKMNRKEPLVILDFDQFLSILTINTKDSP